MTQHARKSDHDRETEGMPPPESPSVVHQLFRREVIEERENKWLGTVLLKPKLSYKVLGITSLLVALALLSFLFLGSYARKETLGGLLVPDTGVIRITSPQVGTLATLLVSEGTAVRAGDLLATISSDIVSRDFGALHERVVRLLTARRDLASLSHDAQQQVLAQQAEQLALSVADVAQEQAHLEEEIRLQQDRLDSAEATVARLATVKLGDAIPINRMVQAKEDRIEQASRLAQLKRSARSLDREALQLKQLLTSLPFQRQVVLGDLAGNVSSLDQQIAEEESKRETALLAPADGRVAGLQAAVGSTVATDTSLMSIVPANSILKANLYVPSRAVGFVRPGQELTIRYSAFPFQKFGTYRGTITSVSAVSLNLSELTPQILSLANDAGGSEPVYKVVVDLESQTATAYGQPVPLQAGMELEADLEIESRSLFEWMLNPLYTLSGR